MLFKNSLSLNNHINHLPEGPIGLVPTIGIPLPFISYGGSSMFTFTTLVFVYINIDANRLNETRI